MLRLPFTFLCGPVVSRQAVRWSSSNHKYNNDLLQMLEQAVRQERGKSSSDIKKVRAVEKAVRIVTALNYDMTSGASVDELKGLNKEVRDRMRAHVEGKEYTCAPQLSEQEIRELMQIPGIARARATKLVQAGCRSLRDLQDPKHFAQLSEVQQAYIQFQSHIEQDSNPSIAEAVHETVKCALNPAHEILTVGAYLRGLPSFPVTEVLIFHPSHVHVPTPDKVNTTGLFSLLDTQKGAAAPTPVKEIINILEQRGIVGTLLRTTSHRWQGVLRIPQRDERGRWEPQSQRIQGVKDRQGVFRRVDITVAPMKSQGAALLTLTGDEVFLAHIRDKATQLGLHFNEFGLWRFHSKLDDEEGSTVSLAPPDSKIKTTPGHWELLPSETEEQIFDELTLDWVEPQKRNFAFLNEKKKPRYKRKL